MQANLSGSFTKEQKVRITNESSALKGKVGTIKKIMAQGGLCIEIEPHGNLFFSRDECRFV